MRLPFLACSLLSLQLVSAAGQVHQRGGLSPTGESSALPPRVSVGAQGMTVEDALWSADLDAEGVRFTPAPRAQGSPSLGLRLVQVRRSGAPWSRHTRPELRLQAQRASFDLGPVEERYDVRDEGLEQSFLLEELPPGGGELLLSIEVSGPYAAEPIEEPRVGAICFRLEGAPRVSYGSAVAIDANGVRVDVPASYRHEGGGGRIDLHVPEGFLESAALPLLVDPAITPITLVDYDGKHASSAYDPIGERYLVAWTQYDSVRCRVYGLDGAPLTAEYELDSTTAQVTCERTSVAFHANLEDPSRSLFVVSWERLEWVGSPLEPDCSVHSQLVLPSTGQAVPGLWGVEPPPKALSEQAPFGTPRWDHGVELAASGDHGLVAWYRRDGGAPLVKVMARAYRVVWNLEAPEMILGDEDVLEASADSSYPLGAHLAVAGALDTTSGGVAHKRWRVVWPRFYTTPAPGDWDVVSAIVETSTTGGVASSLLSIHGVASAIGIDERDPDVALVAADPADPSAARFLVAFSVGGDIRGRLCNGSASIGAAFTIADEEEWLFSPDVGAGATEFTVAYGEADLDPGLNRARVFASRVEADGSVTASHVEVDAESFVASEDPSVSSYPVGVVGVPGTNRALVTWTRESTDVRYRLFEPLVGVVMPYGSACAGPGGTLPRIGTKSGLPHPGNLDFALTLGDAPPVSISVLVYGGIASIPFPGAPGCDLYVGPPYYTLVATTDASGDAEVPFPIPLSPNLDNIYVACQWVVVAPGFNPAGFVFSDDLDLYWTD